MENWIVLSEEAGSRERYLRHSPRTGSWADTSAEEERRGKEEERCRGRSPLDALCEDG